jgi:multimeric flavodoxin WrbA
MTDLRKGQYPGALTRRAFHDHFQRSYSDPFFDGERAAISRLEKIAWEAYSKSRKSPVTRPAGAGFADPGYELSVEWLETRRTIEEARARQADKATPSQVLIICGAARNDGTCPGEISKTFRLAKSAADVLAAGGINVDFLDLSWLTSEYGRKIHPCKACVSTAMPLCHWPCSCYPNHALGQADDWMAEIYARWVSAHGILIVTPVYWYQAPSALKLMIDRLVCADGGNPDPTSTSGKDAAKAKALELKGWSYPKHLAGRAYGLIVHGDVGGAECLRRSLADWLDWMGLVQAGMQSAIDRYIGYYKPYATSHGDLDAETDLFGEVTVVSQALIEAIRELRSGRLSRPDAVLSGPRPK